MKITLSIVFAVALAVLLVFSCGQKVQKTVLGNGIYIKTQAGYKMIIGEKTPLPYTYESRIDGDLKGMELTLAQYQDGQYRSIFSKTIILDSVQAGKGQPILRIELNTDGRAVMTILSSDGAPVKVYKGIIFR